MPKPKMTREAYGAVRCGTPPWPITQEKLMGSLYQLMPALTTEEYEALKASVAENGPDSVVVFDQDGNVIDGHHRLGAYLELGITEFPYQVKHYADEASRRADVRRRNAVRRQLSNYQKRMICKDQMRETPERSDREIGSIVGMDHKTVAAIRRGLEAQGQIPIVGARQGKDGRTRRVPQRPAKPSAAEPTSRTRRPSETPTETSPETASRSIGDLEQELTRLLESTDLTLRDLQSAYAEATPRQEEVLMDLDVARQFLRDVVCVVPEATRTALKGLEPLSSRQAA
jgi:ParB-like chromosome segregation protein Spo0J